MHRLCGRGLVSFGLGALSVACASGPPKGSEAPRSDFAKAEVESFIPARMRRLSNFEYENTVRELLGLDVSVADKLPSDFKVDGYTRNDRAAVSSAYNARARVLAEEMAREFVRVRGDVLACGDRAEEEGAETFISAWTLRALRRPATAAEVTALRDIYRGARTAEKSHTEALSWVVTALLSSPSFLYVSEIGQPTEDPQVRVLSPYEIAAVLSYTLRGAPPDEPLIEAAKNGRLLSSAEREMEARRLLSLSGTRHQFRRFVQEWLEVDGLAATSKDEAVTPYYEDLKPRMLAETSAFVDEVMVHRGASLSALLTAGFSSVDPTMARFYGLSAWGPRVSSESVGRIGLLQQASFLAAHAHPDGTSPIRRGDFILRRVLCIDMPRPDEIGIEVIIPPVTQTETTRQRFSAHVSNQGCASCHDAIDPLGFAFEQFDAAGHFRSSENGAPVDARGTFAFEEFHATFSGSVELSRYLAKRPEATRCFRRHALKFFAADASEAHADAFDELVQVLPEPARPHLLENLVAYVKSDLFLYRRSMP